LPGLSTLALESIIALLSIIGGCHGNDEVYLLAPASGVAGGRRAVRRPSGTALAMRNYRRDPMRPLAIGAAVAASLLLVAIGPQTSIAAEGSKAVASPTAKKHKVVFQVSDDDPRKWNLTLNNVKNIQDELGKDNVMVEIVAYGPGLNMLRMQSPAGDRIGEATQTGVQIVACENTMRNQKVTKADMLPGIGYVDAGVAELLKRQEEGYAYIRP
jgi:intracellular sulfur oxidation DsrE/DsrF family protein